MIPTNMIFRRKGNPASHAKSKREGSFRFVVSQTACIAIFFHIVRRAYVLNLKNAHSKYATKEFFERTLQRLYIRENAALSYIL
jgi:hypothetical protein